MSKIKVGSQFSGVGAFEQSLIRLGIKFKNIYAADWDRYARQTYLLNFEEPEYYVKDVHDTPIQELTEKHGSLDIAMFSPPCQAFSMAGKRMGKDDQRGILFFNSLEFIKENKPRYFIFENVKGLLSHDKQDKNAVYGRTFQEWINYLGGKSVNGVHTFFPYEDSVPYHIYFQVLNAKHYGVPQNRERIFIIGIRDDADNEFSFPKPFNLVKRLKDVLESEVDEKYFLSDTMLTWIDKHREKRSSSGKYPFTEEDDYAGCITARYNKMGAEDIFIGSVKIPTNNSKGYDIAEEEEDSINFSNPNSETRRGRVGHGVAQTLDTACNQGVLVKENWIQGGLQANQPKQTNGISPCLTSAMGMGGGQTPIHNYNQRIRRLTPAECFRLMDFNEDFKWDVSDSQAYKQAGNSIVVNCLVEIIRKFKLNNN